jgi:hypothetical protein
MKRTLSGIASDADLGHDPTFKKIQEGIQKIYSQIQKNIGNSVGNIVTRDLLSEITEAASGMPFTPYGKVLNIDETINSLEIDGDNTNIADTFQEIIDYFFTNTVTTSFAPYEDLVWRIIDIINNDKINEAGIITQLSKIENSSNMKKLGKSFKKEDSDNIDVNSCIFTNIAFLAEIYNYGLKEEDKNDDHYNNLYNLCVMIFITIDQGHDFIFNRKNYKIVSNFCGKDFVYVITDLLNGFIYNNRELLSLLPGLSEQLIHELEELEEPSLYSINYPDGIDTVRTSLQGNSNIYFTDNMFTRTNFPAYLSLCLVRQNSIPNFIPMNSRVIKDTMFKSRLTYTIDVNSNKSNIFNRFAGNDKKGSKGGLDRIKTFASFFDSNRFGDIPVKSMEELRQGILSTRNVNIKNFNNFLKRAPKGRASTTAMRWLIPLTNESGMFFPHQCPNIEYTVSRNENNGINIRRKFPDYMGRGANVDITQDTDYAKSCTLDDFSKGMYDYNMMLYLSNPIKLRDESNPDRCIIDRVDRFAIGDMIKQNINANPVNEDSAAGVGNMLRIWLRKMVKPDNITTLEDLEEFNRDHFDRWVIITKILEKYVENARHGLLSKSQRGKDIRALSNFYCVFHNDDTDEDRFPIIKTLFGKILQKLAKDLQPLAKLESNSLFLNLKEYYYERQGSNQSGFSSVFSILTEISRIMSVKTAADYSIIMECKRRNSILMSKDTSQMLLCGKLGAFGISEISLFEHIGKSKGDNLLDIKGSKKKITKWQKQHGKWQGNSKKKSNFRNIGPPKTKEDIYNSLFLTFGQDNVWDVLSGVISKNTYEKDRDKKFGFSVIYFTPALINFVIDSLGYSNNLLYPRPAPEEGDIIQIDRSAYQAAASNVNIVDDEEDEGEFQDHLQNDEDDEDDEDIDDLLDDDSAEYDSQQSASQNESVTGPVDENEDDPAYNSEYDSQQSASQNESGTGPVEYDPHFAPEEQEEESPEEDRFLASPEENEMFNTGQNIINRSVMKRKLMEPLEDYDEDQDTDYSDSGQEDQEDSGEESDQPEEQPENDRDKLRPKRKSVTFDVSSESGDAEQGKRRRKSPSGPSGSVLKTQGTSSSKRERVCPQDPNFTVKPVLGDGWCYYRSIIEALHIKTGNDSYRQEGITSTSSHLANEISTYMKRNPDIQYQNNAGNTYKATVNLILATYALTFTFRGQLIRIRTFEEYLRYSRLYSNGQISGSGGPLIWADASIASPAVSNMYNINIAILTVYNNGSPYWIVYRPIGPGTQETIYLLHRGGNHFDVLRPRDERLYSTQYNFTGQNYNSNPNPKRKSDKQIDFRFSRKSTFSKGEKIIFRLEGHTHYYVGRVKRVSKSGSITIDFSGRRLKLPERKVKHMREL